MFYLGITEQKNMKGKRGLDRYEPNDSGVKTEQPSGVGSLL